MFINQFYSSRRFFSLSRQCVREGVEEKKTRLGKNSKQLSDKLHGYCDEIQQIESCVLIDKKWCTLWLLFKETNTPNAA